MTEPTLPRFKAPPGPPEPSLEAQRFMEELRALIKAHGWAVQGVVPTADDMDHVEFAYTIGLLERGCMAEVLIAGLPSHDAASIINQIAAEMTSGPGIPPSVWRLENGVQLIAVVFVPRPGSPLNLGVAKAFYEAPALPVVQYVWPDKDGFYPWDAGWNPDIRQPVPSRGRDQDIKG